MDSAILDTVAQKLQYHIPQLMAQHGLPGLVIGVVNDQDLAWAAGFGFADVETERRPDEHTVFRIGSITKTFTATAIMQLCETDKLHLDDPLVRYLPEFAAVRNRFGVGEEITLRKLLTHQAGLVCEAPLSYWETLTFPSMEQILATLPHVEVAIAPASTFKYSNLAYVLLGEVVARLSQRSYIDYVQTEILAPLGMTSTAFALTDALRPRTATGYHPHPYEDFPTLSAQPHLNGLTAVGQLYSSAHDLSKWLALQFRTTASAREGAQILTGRSLEETHRVHYVAPDWTWGYTLGWVAERHDGRVHLMVGGSVPGFWARIGFNKHYRIGVIILTNMWEDYPLALALTSEILDELVIKVHDASTRELRQRPIPTPQHWRPFLGRYHGEWGGVTQIECRAGNLVLTDPPAPQDPQPARIRLDPTDDFHTFTVTGGNSIGEKLVFRPDENRVVTGYVLGEMFYQKITRTAEG